jgi:hypothetical protein
MQADNKIFDDFAKFINGAAGHGRVRANGSVASISSRATSSKW